MMSLVPFVRVEGSAFEALQAPDSLTVARLRMQCGTHLKQVRTCVRYRTESVGLMYEKPDDSLVGTPLRAYSSAAESCSAITILV